MKKVKQIFGLKRKKRYTLPKYQPEEQTFLNRGKHMSNIKKKVKNNEMNYLLVIIALIIIIFTILITLIIRLRKKSGKLKQENYFEKNNNESLNMIFKDMLPRLTPDFTTPPPKLDQIFYSRQLYISGTRITHDYIKYIRPFDEEEEKKFKKRYSENETVIDKSIFEKRNDQYEYLNFCRLALEEKLISDKKIEYDNKPLISIVIPSYNKKNILLKSVRSIQNQNFANIEIIIVNDCSNDNSTEVFDYLLRTDPRIRIIHHLTNLGCWRTRLDGIIYSKGKYVILFDAGDLYEDNYVLTDAFNVIEKYKLDACKFIFRVIRSFNNMQNSFVFFHVGSNDKIIYEPENIKEINFKIFSNWGNIWNCLVRANIYTKAILLLNNIMLNVHKNVWDDVWFNHIVRRASYSFAAYERVGYVYLQDGNGEGSPQTRNEDEKSKIVKEYVGFLYYDYNFHNKNDSIPLIVQKLKEYNETDNKLRLSNFRAHFGVLNDLLEALINDSDVSNENKTFFQQLLKESKDREKNIKNANIKE